MVSPAMRRWRSGYGLRPQMIRSGSQARHAARCIRLGIDDCVVTVMKICTMSAVSRWYARSVLEIR